MLAVSLPILFLLVPIALILAGGAVYGFMWAVRNGQYEDVDTPALRLLLEEEEERAGATSTDGAAPKKHSGVLSGTDGRKQTTS
jgi:cbb3-type cytochrome oxidase maturation protein